MADEIVDTRLQYRQPFDFAMEGWQKAVANENTIDKHIAKCEQQNEDILRRLDRQDKFLWWLIGLIVTALAVVTWDLLRNDLDRGQHYSRTNLPHAEQPRPDTSAHDVVELPHTGELSMHITEGLGVGDLPPHSYHSDEALGDQGVRSLANPLKDLGHVGFEVRDHSVGQGQVRLLNNH